VGRARAQARENGVAPASLTPRRRRRPSRFARPGAILAAALLFTATPTSFWTSLPRVCLFQLAGLPCWGCGMTRALSSALHGQLAEALEHNPLSAIVLPLVVGLVVRTFWREVRRALAPADAPPTS
jgi:hypothetical protein